MFGWTEEKKPQRVFAFGLACIEHGLKIMALSHCCLDLRTNFSDVISTGDFQMGDALWSFTCGAGAQCWSRCPLCVRAW
jgi:hypothetical protein